MAAPNVAIIDCGAGNLHSVRKAVASQLPAASQLDIVTDAAALAHATHIILPGVGAFADCMQGLLALPGMHNALEQEVLVNKKPFLGICVGMQMLFKRGHEHGVHAGLGWFEGEVKPIAPRDVTLRIPHMGWNKLHFSAEGQQNQCSKGLKENDFVYFVHSFAATGCKPAEVLATVDYGGEVVALIGRDNITGAQFHPEKSQAVGLHLLRNFLES